MFDGLNALHASIDFPETGTVHFSNPGVVREYIRRRAAIPSESFTKLISQYELSLVLLLFRS